MAKRTTRRKSKAIRQNRPDWKKGDDGKWIKV